MEYLNIATNSRYGKTTIERKSILSRKEKSTLRGIVDNVRTIIQRQEEYIYIPDIARIES